MFAFQALNSLHDIPVIRSSTTRIQNVYHKAKKTSKIIGLPCHLAETVADKSLKVALTVADPFIEPVCRTANFVLTQADRSSSIFFKPIRTMIRFGKEKLINVADQVYTFCETYIPGQTMPAQHDDFSRRTTLLWNRILMTVDSFRQQMYQFIQSILIWVRLMIIMLLTRVKTVNDQILSEAARNSFLFYPTERLFALLGRLLSSLIYFIGIQESNSDEPIKRSSARSLSSNNKRSQTPQFHGRQTLKPNAFGKSSSDSPSSVDRRHVYRRQES